MMKVAILGASRGLGRAFTEHLLSEHNNQPVCLFLSARRGDSLKPLLRSQDQFFAADFTNFEMQKQLLHQLREFAPNEVYCIAGGGPYGEFATKELKDHLWAYELNLIFPAKLLHFLLSEVPSIKKIIFVGSAVADNKPDENAASYASSKHGLRGLVTTVCLEQQKKSAETRVDIRLFSPGYIDTGLLPRNAHPRQQEDLPSAKQVARELWQWSQSPLD